MSDVVSTVSASGGTIPAQATKKAAAKPAADFKETLKKVEGHHYAKIGNGPRKGEYVNQSGNDRDGKAFRLVERNGHEYHVYGKIVVRVPDEPNPS
jgi:hypothetical protein